MTAIQVSEGLMTENLAWKRISFDPVHPNGVCKELWIYGLVYQLVRKGALWDTPLQCYASHFNSQHGVWLQFGEQGAVCTHDDDAMTRMKNLDRANSYFEAHELSPQLLLNAEIEDAPDPAFTDAMYRHLRKFVEFYFRSRPF